jgi:hypothetical protein
MANFDVDAHVLVDRLVTPSLPATARASRLSPYDISFASVPAA